MPAVPARLPLLLSVVTTLAAAALPAQSDSTARLRGTATSAFNGRGIAGVMIAVPEARQFAVTDSTGTFQLVNLPIGGQKVRIAYEGRETEEFEFEFRPGKTKRLAVVLDVEALDLAPIVVEVRHRDWWRDLAGFYERRKAYAGWARFYTREDVERWSPATLGQLLAREGIYTRCTSANGCVPTRWSRGSLCLVAVSVDGTPFWEEEYDQIPVGDVQGVEVYRTGFMSPPTWGRLMAGTNVVRRSVNEPASVCGSVQIWTR